MIESQFEDIFGEYGTERLTEIDQIIGDQRPEEESYPNIRDWLQNDIFEYHVSRFDNTPVLWKITTENLVSNPTGAGFSCLVDFHQLSPSTFDRLSNQYLEPQKSALREKRASANQRRNDESLSATEKSKATDQFERCTSGLEQIAEFEEVIQELSGSNPRNWNDRDQQLASNLQAKVSDFRKETEKRLSILDELAELEGTEMQELFTKTFYSTVEEERKEWIEALEDLEKACEAYQRDASQPIEAHYYDLLKYFDDLIGSTHFASNGILFMIYYFEDWETHLDEGQPREGLDKEAELLAKLAVDLGDYVDLAEEINEDCQSLAKSIPSSWEERALSEIMTAGYHPKQKHGVEMNIRPLVESNAVPEIVEEKVLE
ncbi:hypothetical protein [Halobacteriaceae bacterium SHR40]|uniref:hypothetical protein n=1 Tax=Halovenus amylolytica TaxID=2500550 RepID=UPI000FE43BE7